MGWFHNIWNRLGMVNYPFKTGSYPGSGRTTTLMGKNHDCNQKVLNLLKPDPKYKKIIFFYLLL
jgi:hypothetical protein